MKLPKGAKYSVIYQLLRVKSPQEQKDHDFKLLCENIKIAITTGKWPS